MKTLKTKTPPRQTPRPGLVEGGRHGAPAEAPWEKIGIDGLAVPSLLEVVVFLFFFLFFFGGGERGKGGFWKFRHQLWGLRALGCGQAITGGFPGEHLETADTGGSRREIPEPAHPTQLQAQLQVRRTPNSGCSPLLLSIS